MKRHSPDWHKSHKYRERFCTYRNCGKPHAAHGLCHKHYGWMRRGLIKVDAFENLAVNSDISGNLSYKLASLRVLPCRICGAPKYYTRCINSVCGVVNYE